MKTFMYKCKTCGGQVEHDRLLVEDDVCLFDSCGGRIRRDYKAEQVAPARVPGGGRPHRG